MENLKSDKFDDDTDIAIDVHDLMVLFLMYEANQGESSKFYVMGVTSQTCEYYMFYLLPLIKDLSKGSSGLDLNKWMVKH